MEDTLTWDDSFAIAQQLRMEHQNVDLEQVSLMMIYQWTLALKIFDDDPGLCNDAILMAIYREWFEEANSL